jgi:hypothetical protein
MKDKYNFIELILIYFILNILFFEKTNTVFKQFMYKKQFCFKINYKKS